MTWLMPGLAVLWLLMLLAFYYVALRGWLRLSQPYLLRSTLTLLGVELLAVLAAVAMHRLLWSLWWQGRGEAGVAGSVWTAVLLMVLLPTAAGIGYLKRLPVPAAAWRRCLLAAVVPLGWAGFVYWGATAFSAL